MNGVKSFTTGQGNVQETNTGGHLQSAGKIRIDFVKQITLYNTHYAIITLFERSDVCHLVGTFAFRKRWCQIDWRSLGTTRAFKCSHSVNCINYFLC